MSSGQEKQIVEAVRMSAKSLTYCRAAFVAAGLLIVLGIVQAVVVGKVFMWETRVTGASHHLTAALVAYAGAPLRQGIWGAFQIAGLGFLVLIAARFVEHQVAAGPAIDEKLARRGTRLAKWLYRLAWFQLVLSVAFGVPVAYREAAKTLDEWRFADAVDNAPMLLLTAGHSLSTLAGAIMIFFSMVLIALLICVLVANSRCAQEEAGSGEN